MDNPRKHYMPQLFRALQRIRHLNSIRTLQVVPKRQEFGNHGVTVHLFNPETGAWSRYSPLPKE